MILCSGCFDCLHAAHVRYLEAAKALCIGDELLVCVVAPDAYILAHKNRSARWSLADRLYTVRGLMAVDAAVAQTSLSVASDVRAYRPRLLVKGEDWYGRLPDDVLAACMETGTMIAFVHTPGRHVSETLETS